jgi:integrase
VAIAKIDRKKTHRWVEEWINRLQKYLEKAGIRKELSFHDLRKAFIKTAKRKGLSPKAVSQITGDTLSTIEQSYANLDIEELKEEIGGGCFT